MPIKIIKTILLLAFLSISLFSKTTKELATIISNSTISIQYYFFINDGKAFLSKKRSDNAYAIWHYTDDKKWQPIHNASAFDGFDGADKIFSNVAINDDRTKINIGSITGVNIGIDALYLARKIENTNLDIGWYFWTTKGSTFLLKPNTDGTISIWSYTEDRRWRPVHNADAFDGFPAVGTTLDNLNFNPRLNTLAVGNVSIRKDKPLGTTSNAKDKDAKLSDKFKLPAGYRFSPSGAILYDNGERVDMTNMPADLKAFFDEQGYVIETGMGKPASDGSQPDLPIGYKFGAGGKILHNNGTEVDMTNIPADLQKYFDKYFST